MFTPMYLCDIMISNKGGRITMKNAKKSNRKDVNTTLDKDLYANIKMLAIRLGVCANDLIEEGMRYVLEKNKQ